MAYTVSHLYDKVSIGVDKIGSDLITLKDVMNRVEAAAFDFVGESVKYIENTQEIRDDIRTLYKPFSFNVIELPTIDPQETFYGVSLPHDYMHLQSYRVIKDANAKTTDTPGKRVRDTRLVRHGQEEIYFSDPNKVPTSDYPLLVLYQDYIRVYSEETAIKINGFYIKKPTIWAYNLEDNTDEVIAVDLPEHSTDKIIKDIINDIFITIGDPRGQIQYQAKEQYRKRGSNSLNN